MLFFYASNYGLTLQERVSNQYWKEYATGALETILYTSTPRVAGQSLEETSEVDYLLAAVKEDFAENGKIEETADVLKQNIKGIMQPVAPGFDYMFYFYLFARQRPRRLLHLSSAGHVVLQADDVFAFYVLAARQIFLCKSRP